MTAVASSNAFEWILDQLEGVRRTGNTAMAKCPAHEDRKASLSIKVADQFAGVVLNCHAGCTTEAIMAAIKGTIGDLFDEQRDAKRGYTVTAEYPYTDETGNVLWVKERRYPKDFRQYVPLPDGTKQWSLNGTRRVLYQLPEVVAAIAQSRTVFVVEGEKDADAIRAAGKTATCNTEGASKNGQSSKWRNEYTEQLRGGMVTIVADKDEAGRAHAQHIAKALIGVAAHVRIVEAIDGKDAYDHLQAGYHIEDFAETYDQLKEPEQLAAEAPKRRLILTSAADIKPKRVRWMWDARIALGTLALLAGREGVGKSMFVYWLVAMLTKGTLPGEFYGQPKAVLVAATEDSWAQTIVPRLIAADANLTPVYRVEVITDTVHSELTMPKDINDVMEAVRTTDAALLVLDPLISRLDGALDSHKDAEVRLALEPLVRMADEIHIAILGLMHHNKSGSSDPLTAIMASRAFTAVARSVHTVIRDPDDETNTRKLFGTPKNNLGRTDLPTLGFTIDSYPIETDEDEIAWTGRLIWGADSNTTIFEAMERGSMTTEQKSSAAEAADWLYDHLAKKGGTSESAPVKKAAKAAGHTNYAIHSAREKLGILVEQLTGATGHATVWTLPESVTK